MEKQEEKQERVLVSRTREGDHVQWHINKDFIITFAAIWILTFCVGIMLGIVLHEPTTTTNALLQNATLRGG